MEPAIEGNGFRLRLGKDMAGDAFEPEPCHIEMENDFRRGVVDPTEDAVFFEHGDALHDLVIQSLVEPRCPAAGDLGHQLIEVLAQEPATTPEKPSSSRLLTSSISIRNRGAPSTPARC